MQLHPGVEPVVDMAVVGAAEEHRELVIMRQLHLVLVVQQTVSRSATVLLVELVGVLVFLQLQKLLQMHN